MNYTYRIPALIALLLSLPLCSERSTAWHHPYHDGVDCPTKVLFAPGLFQSEMTAVYYCGFYTASTGEQFVSQNPFRVMSPDHVTSCNFCEIRPIKQGRHLLDRTAPLRGYSHLFSHALGLRDGVYHSVMKISCTNPGLHDTTICKHTIDLSQLNIGQDADVQRLANAYEQIDGNSDIVMYGFSRGSATTFNFLATVYQATPNKRVKAAVLAGCFDAIEHILEEQWKWMPHDERFTKKIYDHAVTHFPSFGAHRVEPIDLAPQFPPDIPLLLIASKVDGIVPYVCTCALYERLKETGHQQVYLLTLKNAWHSGHLFSDNESDRKRYLYTVHAFYKQYGLSYIDEYAQKGTELLAECATFSYSL